MDQKEKSVIILYRRDFVKIVKLILNSIAPFYFMQVLKVRMIFSIIQQTMDVKRHTMPVQLNWGEETNNGCLLKVFNSQICKYSKMVFLQISLRKQSLLGLTVVYSRLQLQRSSVVATTTRVQQQQPLLLLSTKLLVLILLKLDIELSSLFHNH